MRILIFFCCMFFLIVPNYILAKEIPMVKHHLFSPEGPEQAPEEPPAPPEAEKKIDQEELNKKLKLAVQFFGVVISSEPKALLKDIAASRTQQDAVSLYKKGDTIGEFELLEIHSNYIRLKGFGGEIDYKLFSADKKRPARPKGPPKAPNGKKASKDNKVKPQKNVQPGKASAQGNKDNNMKQQLNNQANTNPFLQALQKARQRKAEQGNNPPANQIPMGDNNPFKALIDKIQAEKRNKSNN